MKKPESICIFGDSTSWGAWDHEKGGWVNRLWLYIGDRDEDYVELYNLSISGATTDTILKRFESESIIRKADALIFQSGANDCSYKDNADNQWIPINKFESNVQEIIDKARKITDKIIFIGSKKCDESKTMPVAWANVFFTNENIKKYNAVMKSVCDRNHIIFIDVFDLIDTPDLDDGIHPNVVGHKKVFDYMKLELERMGWI
jgi:lysophospholipase L1-like esterase